MGGDEFREKLQQGLGDVSLGVAKNKAILRHLPLAEIEHGKSKRGIWMREAYCEHGYTMQAIAEFAGVHHSTVSKLIQSTEENPRIKP